MQKLRPSAARWSAWGWLSAGAEFLSGCSGYLLFSARWPPCAGRSCMASSRASTSPSRPNCSRCRQGTFGVGRPRAGVLVCSIRPSRHWALLLPPAAPFRSGGGASMGWRVRPAIFGQRAQVKPASRAAIGPAVARWRGGVVGHFVLAHSPLMQPPGRGGAPLHPSRWKTLFLCALSGAPVCACTCAGLVSSRASRAQWQYSRTVPAADGVCAGSVCQHPCDDLFDVVFSQR